MLGWALAEVGWLQHCVHAGAVDLANALEAASAARPEAGDEGKQGRGTAMPLVSGRAWVHEGGSGRRERRGAADLWIWPTRAWTATRREMLLELRGLGGSDVHGVSCYREQERDER